MDLAGKQTYLLLRQDGTHEEIEWTGQMPVKDMEEYVGGAMEAAAWSIEPPMIIIRNEKQDGEENVALKGHKGTVLIGRVVRSLSSQEGHIVGLTFEQLTNLRHRFGIPQPPLPKREIG